MRSAPVIRAVWQHYLRHPLQLVLLLTGLITGAVMVNGVWLLNEAAKRDYQRGEQLIGQQAYATISAINHRDLIAEADYVALRNAGFAHLVPVVTGSFKDTQGRLISILATDPLAFRAEDSFVAQNRDKNKPLEITDLMLPPYQFWGSSQRLGQLEMRDGDRLFPPGFNDGIVVREINERGLGHQLWTDIGLGQQLLGMSKKLSYIALMDHSGMSDSELQRIAEALPATLKLELSRSEFTLAQMTQSLHLNLTAMGLLAWVVGIFIAFNAIHFSLQDRARLFNQLRTLGVPQGVIARVLLLEWTALALLTALIAAPISVWLSEFLLPLLGRTLDNLYAVRLSYQTMWSGWSAEVLLRALAVSITGVVLAAAGPWWQFIRAKQEMQSLFVSAKTEMLSGTSWQLKLAQLGLLMLLAAILIALLVPGLYSGFLVIALVLLGTGFIVPMLFSKGLAVLVNGHLGFNLSKTKHPNSRFSIKHWPVFFWSITELRWQVSRTHVAMVALVLALTANVGVNTMVNSFRQTVLTWLDQRLIADVYVRPQAEPASLIRWLEVQPEVQKLFYQRQLSVAVDRFAKQGALQDPDFIDHAMDKRTVITGSLLSLSSEDMAQRAISLYQSKSDFTWQSFAAGEGILISQRLHLLNGLNVGDKITVSVRGFSVAAGGNNVAKGRSDPQFTVVGVYYDYGNPNPQLMLDEHTFEKYWPEVEISGIGILLAEPSDIAALVPRMRDTFALTDRQIIDQQSMRSVAVSIFDQTFVATEALNLLTLLVSALGLASALFLLNERRRKALGVIACIGVSKRRLYFISVAQWASVGVLCTLLSLPFGIGLAWVLINLLNVYGFGWSYPLDLPWIRYLQLALMAGIVTSITAILALRRLHHWSIARQISEAE